MGLYNFEILISSYISLNCRQGISSFKITITYIQMSRDQHFLIFYINIYRRMRRWDLNNDLLGQLIQIDDYSAFEGLDEEIYRCLSALIDLHLGLSSVGYFVDFGGSVSC